MVIFSGFSSFPRSGVGMPSSRSSGLSLINNRDAGASGPAPTPERGSQMKGSGSVQSSDVLLSGCFQNSQAWSSIDDQTFSLSLQDFFLLLVSKQPFGIGATFKSEDLGDDFSSGTGVATAGVLEGGAADSNRARAILAYRPFGYSSRYASKHAVVPHRSADFQASWS